jgi:hypothetical protein
MDLFSVFAQFLRENPLQILVMSGILLIPIYWHRPIEAGDLERHVYNAWLVHLIRRGQAPGLWIAQQRNSILIDVILSGLGEIFGPLVAERIAVSCFDKRLEGADFRIADGLLDGTTRRGQSDSQQRHRPVGYVAECDGLEDFPCVHTIGIAIHLAPRLRGRAGDNLQG